MSLRPLLWAAMAAVVLALAVASARLGTPAAPPAAVPASDGAGPEVTLRPVEVRELHDDGQWNRLTADAAVYSYARRTVRATGVAVSLGRGNALRGAVIRAPEALWDFDARRIALPAGGHADRQGDWKGDLSAGSIDLAQGILRVPGAASVRGPGFSVAGTNLEWSWWAGRITLDSPRSRIAPAALPRREG